MLGKAILIASTVHASQKDKGGNAYILHPIRIMMRLRTTDDELMQIAILHDVVEDSKEWDIEKLAAEGFSYRVLTALDLLTHNSEDSYQDYIKNISTNADAIRVKIEDLRDNSDITRLKGLKEKDFKRMEKYHRAFQFLKATLENAENCGY